MNELIEKLKHEKQYCFGFLSKEEQDCLKKVGKNNCMYLSDYKNTWEQAPDGTFCHAATYRIKPDYQFEPEYEDYKITPNADTWLGSLTPTGNWVRLYKIIAMPNFVTFVDEDGFVALDEVSRRYNSKKIIFARFRK